MPGTVEERKAARARTLEKEVKKGTEAIRLVWGHLAKSLHEFKEGGMWEYLGYEDFNSWIASPEIDLGRSQVYALIEAYQVLVLEREMSTDDLGKLEVTKVAQVLPAIRKGAVELEDAISDVEVLSRSDLREKYGKAGAGGAPPLEMCNACGHKRQKEPAAA